MTDQPNPLADLTYQQVTLDRLKVTAQARLSPSVLHTLRLDSRQDAMLDDLVYQLSARILAQQLDQHTITRTTTIDIDRPDGWWQHWKADHHNAAGWAIRWLARRSPVRTTTEHRTVTLTATWHQYATFPEATIVTDDRLGEPVRVLTVDSDIRPSR